MSWFWGSRKVEEELSEEEAEVEEDVDVEEETKPSSTTTTEAADTTNTADDRTNEEGEEQQHVHTDDESHSNNDDGDSHGGDHGLQTNISSSMADRESKDEEDSDADSETDDDDDDDGHGDDGEKSLHSLTTEEDDISFIDSDEADSMADDEDYEGSDDDTGHDHYHYRDRHRDHQSPSAGKFKNDTSTSHQDEKKSNTKSNINGTCNGSVSNEKKDAGGDDDDDDDNQIPSSFWEKRGLLVLAAEHDRVDILNAVLKDNKDGDKERLMNSGGVPPLHLAITFSSVNTAIALLRMGADPSVRPDIQKILEDEKTQPEDSKVEIPHLERFDGASAWELAFGNDAYEKFKSKKESSRSWSLFGGGSSSVDIHSDDEGSEVDGSKVKRKKKRIIKPADMPPSKREGIRHAFTAEALRSVGSDEVERLMQLIEAGMPATVDIGGKDLYGWTVEMGALRCEEALRHVSMSDGESATARESAVADPGKDDVDTATTEENKSALSSGTSFKVHRPTNETVPQLRNRLDELESLASALSTCLDNLAEEVSVCHGLLLLGGGASTLASHVKSLKALKEQKLQQLEDSQLECQRVEQELFDLADSIGTIGQKILNSSTSQLDFHFKSKDGDDEDDDRHDSDQVVEHEESEEEKRYLIAQIAATEHKTRKLRASISDLSEENSRDMAEVERRGLEGGINLVRGIREELRDVEFQLSEIQSLRTTYRAKISMIHAQVPSISTPSSEDSELKHNHSSTDDMPSVNGKSVNHGGFTEASVTDKKVEQHETRMEHTDREAIDGQNNHRRQKEAGKMSENPSPRHGATKPSEKIASGDSTAIQVIRPGHHGFFPLDLWQVLLRIIGFERAAYRRGLQQQQQQQQLQQTKTKKPPPPPNTFIV